MTVFSRIVVSATAAFFLLSTLSSAIPDREVSHEALLTKLKETAYLELPGWSHADIGTPTNLLKFGVEDMADTFDREQETLPDNRPKLIHARGSTAAVHFNITNPFDGTGLFATGGDSCVLRLSVAANPAAIGFAPGLALKCFRDQTPSGNIIAMYSLDGQGENFNYFANEQSNIIPKPSSPALQVLAKFVFARASHCPTWLSLRQWASIDQEGQVSDKTRYPQQIFFAPAEVNFSEDKDHGDFRKDLESIAVGTKVFDVYALAKHGHGTRFKIGEVTTTSKFFSSQWQDDDLFFQHDRGDHECLVKTL